MRRQRTLQLQSARKKQRCHRYINAQQYNPLATLPVSSKDGVTVSYQPEALLSPEYYRSV